MADGLLGGSVCFLPGEPQIIVYHFSNDHDCPRCADNAVVKNVEFTIELEWFACYNCCIGSA